uniref:POU domain class 6 transcription factor n=1 Tax=Craspedacusta sowerbii TaxID=128124 RepID=G4XIJ1_CRASO|nr:POU domain class 6 transcription factor [Craspedacusta sowerbii]
MTSSMPGLAPINVYSATSLGGKASAVSGVLLHLKTPDGTSSGPHLMTSSMLKRSLSAREDSSGLSIDMQNFINDFKARRIALGYTQDDVGREMSVLNGPTYSQSFISRFEGKQLGMKAAERMRPILDAWIQSKEEEFHRGSKFAKKRRKRTSFSPDLLDVLLDYFNKNQKPTPEELQMIAQKTGLDVTTVKVWFCNKKQSLKRAGQPVQDNTLRAEIDAKRKLKSEDELNDNVFAFAQSASLKTFVPVSTPAGAVTVPFFVNQDGSSIAIVSAGTAANQSDVQRNLPADDAGDHMATTLSQHVILSNVNILPSMAVVDNALQSPASIAFQGASQSHNLVDGSRLLQGGTALHHIQGLTRSMTEPNCALNDNDDLGAESRSHVSHVPRNKSRGVGSLSGILEVVHNETSLNSGCIANSGCDVSGMATDSVILQSEATNMELRQKVETRSKKSFVSKQKQNYVAAAAATESNSDDDRNDAVLQ